jgi:ribosomal protein S27E
MYPHIWTITHGVARALLRQCHRCGHRQAATREQRHDPVTCDQCGAEIQPPQAASGRPHR